MLTQLELHAAFRRGMRGVRHGYAGSRHSRVNPRKDWTSIWSSVHTDGDGRIVKDHRWNLNLRPDAGDDWQAECMAGDNTFIAAGTASASSATSLTSAGLTASAHIGKIIACGPNASGTGVTTYGVITQNSTSIFTVDRWYDPASPSGAVIGPPNATAKYVVLPGQHPAVYLALSTTVQSGAAGDTTLPGECTNASNPGMQRAFYTTYTHTAGATSYSLAKTYTCGATTTTVNSGALFNSQWDGSASDRGVLAFIFAETSPPTLVSGDTLAQTCTVNY